jgi:putative glutamine amidotransferase
MTSPQPRIAIPEPTSTDAAYNQRSLPHYLRSIEAAGGIPVTIPLQESPEVQKELLSSCAGILLPGSPADVDPSRYGEDRHKETAATDAPREAADNLLLQDAFALRKPVLGVCYGLQSMNVWLGGSLIQDLPSEEPADGNRVDHSPGRTVEEAHSLRVKPGSRLSTVLKTGFNGSPQVFVNSSHHQAVGRPAASLNVVATSPMDGVIEGLEGDTPQHFVLGVQWHPERTYESSLASRELFAALVDASRSWKP